MATITETFLCRNAHKNAIYYILDNMDEGESNAITVTITKNEE